LRPRFDGPKECAESEFESAIGLTAEQGKRLLAGADRDSLRGKRNYAILAMDADFAAANCSGRRKCTATPPALLS
jgi:hypothetical protein